MKLFYRGGFVPILLAGVMFAGGVAEAASPTTVTWKVSSLNRGEKKRLLTLVSTKSPGVKTWSKRGSCALTPLGKPTTLTMGVAGSCTLTLRIAKSGRYAAKIFKKTITFATTVVPTTTTSPTVPTTTTTTTTAPKVAVVAPRVVSASSATGNAVITIADMSPDTGVYAVQWVPVGQDFDSYQMHRTTTKTMTVPYLSCTRSSYTLRVFVMQENWQMSNGFVNQNVTPHSTTFDLTMPACTSTAVATTTTTTTVTVTAPAFTLSSSSESKEQNTAITGYTITSTGGAVASYAISPAVPTGISFSTSTGLLSGTPTTVQSATVYTITATNATSTATQTFTLTVTVTAPAFTLSSSSESKEQNTAITGYTITSTGGAVASYAISPAVPTGISFSTSTGLLSGTPTTVQSATVYTITATNATSTATQTFTLTVTVDSCATGGSCTPGVSTGAGGGRVFYYSATAFTSTGSDCGTNCHYLEAATRYYGWEDWCTDHNYTTLGVTATGIGSGMANTITANVTCTSGAFQVVADYNNNGKYDWFLPSKDELNELYAYRTQLGFDLYTFLYWSSSEYNHAMAWIQDFGDGDQFSYWKSTRHVVPVRAG